MAEILRPVPKDAAIEKSPALATETPNLIDRLRTEFSDTKRDFDKDVAKQGVVGETFDWMKGHLGASASSGEGMLRRGWSSVLNYDESSAAIRENLAVTQQKLSGINGDSSTESLVRNLGNDVQVEADGKVSMNTSLQAQIYDRSQFEGVNEITNAVAFSLSFFKASEASSLVKSALVGAGAKTALKALDGGYSTPVDDAISGAMNGAAGSLSHLGGKASDALFSRLQKRGASYEPGSIGKLLEEPFVQTKFRTGMRFAPIGMLASTADAYSDNRYDGDERLSSFGQALKDAPVAAAKGFIAGSILATVPFVAFAEPVLEGKDTVFKFPFRFLSKEQPLK